MKSIASPIAIDPEGTATLSLYEMLGAIRCATVLAFNDADEINNFQLMARLRFMYQALTVAQERCKEV
jgi:hypothetical protein